MTDPRFAVTTDAGRYYNIVGYEDTVFRSVTTALNVLSKPALVPWAGKLVAERAYKAMRDGTLQNMKRDVALKYLKAAPKEATKESQERGTAVHKLCEEYRDGMEVPDEFVGYVEQYKAFLKYEGFTIIEQELTVFSPEFGYAGTLDAIVEKDGKHYVMDIKTGGVYPSASLQMAAYAHATHKIDGSGATSKQEIDIEGGFVLQLHEKEYKLHYMDVSEEQFSVFKTALELAIWNTETSRSVIGDQFK